VSSAPSVMSVDLIRQMMMRVRPERKPAPPDAPEDFVKLLFAYQKGVMLRRNLAFSVVEVQSDLIIHPNRQERSTGNWSREPEHYNKKACGLAFAPLGNDGVVKLNAHSHNSFLEKFRFVYSISQSQYPQCPCQESSEQTGARGDKCVELRRSDFTASTF